MPNIPTFGDQEVNVRPSGAAQISPSAMAAPGAAAARVGDEQTDLMTSFLARRTEAVRASDAAHLTAQASETLGNLQHKWSLVPNRDVAQAGFDADQATARQQLLSGITDPYVQSHVAQSFDGEVISRRYDTANAAFGLESQTRNAQRIADNNMRANAAATATNDALRAKMTDDGIGAIKGDVAAGWLNPVDGENQIIQFRSQIQDVKARGIKDVALETKNSDVARTAAHALDDPNNFPGLLPERREILQGQLLREADSIDTRNASRQQHLDIMADKALRQSQAHNEATLLAGVLDGKSISDSDIAHLADTQQITAGGVEALHTAKIRAENGNDNPTTTLHLWHGIDTKQVSSGDIYDALNKGDISKTTSVAMMRAADSNAKKQDDQVVRASFGQLKTVLHGGAIEQGIIPDKSPEAALWAQAQGEWARRVTVGGENPKSVLPDMLQRYSHDTAAPTWLDQPKLGVVQSSQDLTGVIAKTGHAFKAGKISQGDYTAQLQLLSKYKQFYGLQAPKPKPAGAKP